MNVLVNGFSGPEFKILIDKIYHELGINYCQIIIDKKVFQLPASLTNKIETIDYRSLSFADYSWADWNAIPPLDASLLEKLMETEILFLKMMDRLEQHIGKISYAKRKRLYLRHVKYWNHYLDQHQINFFLSQTIPHENYDFIIYSLCKIKGIPFFCFFQTMPDFVFYLSDYKEYMPEIKEKYEELKSQNPDTIIWSDRAENLLKFYTSEEKDPVPIYMKKTTVKFGNHISGKFNRIFSKIFSAGLYQNISKRRSWNYLGFTILNKIYYPLAGRKNRSFYKRHSIKPPLEAPYVYLPLHMQPELTTSPLGGPFVDQVLIAEMLSFCLPVGVKIYIKEHPRQNSYWGRNLDFYKDLLAIDKVEFIPTNFSSYSLIQHCIAVATVTGTAAWEAVFKGIPSLLFGHQLYQHAPGIFKIQSLEDCKKAIHQIIEHKYKPSRNELKLFLTVLDEFTINGFYNPVYKKSSSPFSDEENAQLLFDKIKRFVEASVK